MDFHRWPRKGSALSTLLDQHVFVFCIVFCCACTPMHNLSDMQPKDDTHADTIDSAAVGYLLAHAGEARAAVSLRPMFHKDPEINTRRSDWVEPEQTEGGPDQCVSQEPYQRAQLATGVRWIPQLSRFALLYYLPNRIMDLIDIFRFDVGFGVSYGAVVRITPRGQLGYRGFSTPSFRIGPHGRYVPYFVERYDEYGFGPGFKSNRPRILSMTPAELAVSADVGVMGVYAGVSFDEALDFILGILLIDFKGDDVIR